MKTNAYAQVLHDFGKEERLVQMSSPHHTRRCLVRTSRSSFSLSVVGAPWCMTSFSGAYPTFDLRYLLIALMPLAAKS
jgi:hypothetical protein